MQINKKAPGIQGLFEIENAIIIYLPSQMKPGNEEYLKEGYDSHRFQKESGKRS